MDRNGSGLPVFLLGRWSLSARRAWIEISVYSLIIKLPPVALRKESVDRNRDAGGTESIYNDVALRKESVDRNSVCNIVLASIKVVALRKESVDRNPLMCFIRQTPLTSLSARRAWIEI